jgi:hypothetical protein
MKTHLLFYFIFFTFGLTLLNNNLFAQAPTISYTPSTNVYTAGTPIPILSPVNSGGAVTSLAYGAAVPLTGAVLNNPYGMGIDPAGNIYAVNFGNNTVSKYNSAGIYQGTFATTSLSNPAGIIFDQAGNGYVLNYNRTNNGNGNFHGNAYVSKYNSAGVYVSTIIQGLGTSNGITVDPSDNLYIAEGSYNNGTNTVDQYNTSGALAFSLNNTNTANPVNVAVDGSGYIYVLDNTNLNVTKYNSAGVYLSTVVTGLSNPNAFYVDGAGDIYIGDSGAHTVTVYNPSGVILTTITGLTDPEGIVTDSKGNMYVSDYTNGTVTKYPVTGGYYLSGVLPAGLSFDSATGVFSGTPTTSFAAATYTVTAYNASGSGSATVTLSCPANTSAPAISYNPTINVFTTTSLITPLSPIVTGGIPTSYTISTALPAGLVFNTTTGIISGTPTATSAAKIYTITGTNGSGSSSTVISIACVVDNYWTGKKDKFWSEKLNWSTKNVPVATDLASIGVINYTGPDPVVDASVSINYVRFGANAGSLTVNSGATFTVNNALIITNNATPTFTGTVVASVTGAINIAPLAVVNILGTGALTITSPLTVTLKSDATGSATIGEITGGSITGNVNVERYFQGSTSKVGSRYVERGYRIISSPVYNTTVGSNKVYGLNYIVGNTAGQTTGANSTTNAFITGCTGGSTSAGNPSIYLYREDRTPSNASFTSGNYIGITNITNSTSAGTIGASDGGTYSIPVGNGVLFFFRGAATNWATRTASPFIAPENVTLTSTGSLNQGTITINDWFTPAAGLSNTITGFNMVGNPYASSIDWETSTYGNKSGGIITSNLDAAIYVFNPVNQQFEAYSASLHAGTGSATRIIASGQGFFVHSSNAGPATLQFKESAKSELSQNTGSYLLMGKPAAQVSVQQIMRLKLVTDSVNYSDIVIGFNSTASPRYNGKEDAKYVSGPGAAEGLASISDDNVRLSINALPLPKQALQIIKLSITAAKTGQYTLQRTALEAIPQIYDIWLMDRYKKDSLDIRNNSTYIFTIDLSDTASYGRNRFTIVIRQNPALGTHLLNFAATKTTDGAEIIWKTENEQNYTNFTVERSSDNGKNFVVLGGFLSDAGKNYSLLDKNPPAAADQYRLKIEDLNGEISYSKIITLMYANSNNHTIISNISVYPNPTTERVNLAINQTSSNTAYNIQMTNNMGSVVRTATLTQPTWQSDISKLLPGIYFITVRNKNDNSIAGRTSFVKL